ncbi:PREDICTED: WD repeat-containing protein 43-like isoform X2 [Branchiostoma belcheri]|uniref:WD repeat-containing protein 43-like isoform X2 n=1 Tax=Branchiostoma belcheri TaxID=7741 RepID=A0A6P4Z7W2_BRABE|nr:PREDICTED: WD repeat-containing protein 43-like isoform X2 [Branchiostoma belcheri]
MATNFAERLCQFSPPSSDCLARASADGRLQLWDTGSGAMRQEYTPSAHLSATCSCLAWGPLRENEHKKRKRKSDQMSALSSLDIIAMGTTAGTILLYSVVKGDLQSQLTGGHDDIVNCLCWHAEENSLFSCSDDQHIVEWTVTTAQVKCKWKADKGSVQTISLGPGGKTLLSAARIIKLWDLEKREVLLTFTGHASLVTSLLFATLPPPPANGRRKSVSNQETTVDGLYFLSGAVHDRLMNAWQIKMKSKEKTAVVSFSLTEEPVYVDVLKPRQKDQPAHLAVVTRNGDLHIFKFILNGRGKKPLTPQHTIQVATQGGQATPTPLPIIAAQFCPDLDTTLRIAYGTGLRPAFERIQCSTLEKHTCLIRTDPGRSSITLEEDAGKVKTPGKAKEVTVLAPGHMTHPAAPSSKKNKKKSTPKDLSIQERLDVITTDQGQTSGGDTTPRADTLAVLLTQGLQSEDSDILQRVFSSANETLIRNTVQRIPVSLVVPLLKEVTRRMHGRAGSGMTVQWLRAVLETHTSYLMTCPDVVSNLGSLYELLDSRVATFSKLSRLQGKLKLVLSQTTAKDEQQWQFSSKPLLSYKDESSDEQDDAMEDLLHGHPDSDEDWEEMSDMETQEQDGEQEEEEEGSSQEEDGSSDEVSSEESDDD